MLVFYALADPPGQWTPTDRPTDDFFIHETIDKVEHVGQRWGAIRPKSRDKHIYQLIIFQHKHALAYISANIYRLVYMYVCSFWHIAHAKVLISMHTHIDFHIGPRICDGFGFGFGIGIGIGMGMGKGAWIWGDFLNAPWQLQLFLPHFPVPIS